MGALWTFRGAESCRASSASVTPSVIPRKEGMVQVTASDKSNLDMDVAKLESMGCLFGNRQGQRKVCYAAIEGKVKKWEKA